MSLSGIEDDPKPVPGPATKKAKTAMHTDVGGALAAILDPFVTGPTFMVWSDECVIDSEVNHETKT